MYNGGVFSVPDFVQRQLELAHAGYHSSYVGCFDSALYEPVLTIGFVLTLVGSPTLIGY